MALQHILCGLLEYAANEHGSKSVSKAIKDGGKDTLNRIVKRMCEPAKRFLAVLSTFLTLVPILRLCSARRAMIVDLALSVNGSQLIASVLPNVCFCDFIL
jgi:hypothetical protein